MKRIEIRNAEEVIRRANLKMMSREAAGAVVKLHLAIFERDKETSGMMDEARKILLNGREDEVKRLTELRESWNKTENEDERKLISATIVSECEPILKTEQELVKQYDAIMNEDVKVKFEKLDASEVMELLEACGENFNIADVDSLRGIIA